MQKRFIKWIKDPQKAARSFITRINEKKKYKTPEGYDAQRYWQDRHLKHGFDLRGVGIEGLTDEENQEMYVQAKNILLSFCSKLNIDFTKTKMLDVGCGTGFYTKIFHQNGGQEYLGVDITDILFNKYKEQFPNFKFQKLDITAQKLEGVFDLAIMIDVTQHITDAQKFSFAMRNIKSSLSETGIFIVTSWLKDNARKSFYEVSRSMDCYKKEFPGYAFSKPAAFRDKFIFSIRKEKQ